MQSLMGLLWSLIRITNESGDDCFLSPQSIELGQYEAPTGSRRNHIRWRVAKMEDPIAVTIEHSPSWVILTVM